MNRIVAPVLKRGRFAGLLQILRFNYPMFAGAAATAALAIAALVLIALPSAMAWAMGALAIAALAWTVLALGVSWWVYDLAPTFQFRWLGDEMGNVQAWANIHAGFDQTTAMLRATFSGSTGTPVDIYDPAIMTEPSIHRARAYYPAVPGTMGASFDRVPLDDTSVDAVFMLFAAHELRRPAQRLALFREAQRLVRPGGIVALAEHPRGLANFLAFGPGVFHFHSRRQWRRAGSGAGMVLARTGPLTPFAFFQIWRKNHDA